MIFGLMGFPRMGVAGAALATVLSQMVGTGMGLYYNLRKNPEIRLSLSGLRPSKPVIARIYGVGIPSILLQTVSSLLIFGLNQILVTFSEDRHRCVRGLILSSRALLSCPSSG